ncbi:heat shock factor protein HSF30-like [Nicotiana tabacum]|uniref:Heat shock factor protein HSF30-like n=1 Tax=Nicotiana tabacum TaxID=4097 RepID=A0AC58S5E3_TOBAC
MATNNISQFSGSDVAIVLHKPRIPPFLTKTYEMVDDPNTNSIISWSLTSTSFIIWDHIRLCSQLLPQYFKHENLSSFIYQLNNYGFKKIGLQKWEYEHYWFRPGKKHLLSNIKRRNQNQKIQEHCYQENYYNGVVTELRSQRDFNVTLMSEIEKMKEKQDDLANRIASLREYLEKSDAKFRKLLCLLAKGIKQVAMQQAMKNDEQTKKRKVEDIAEICKNVVEKKMDDLVAIKQVHEIMQKKQEIEIEKKRG